MLGAGTAGPHPNRSPSGHLLQSEKMTGPVLVDMGAGTLWRLARAGVSWESLAAIFITHTHLDHCLDLQSLFFASRGGHGRTEPLPIYLSGAARDFFETLAAPLGKWFEPRGFDVQWHTVSPGRLRVAGLDVEAREVAHHHTSLGWRFGSDEGWSVAYSGDSDYCEGLVALCEGASLAVLECSTPDEEKYPGHMTPRDVARVALEARLETVALVHRYASLDAVDIAARLRTHGFTGEVVEAQDGTRIMLDSA